MKSPARAMTACAVALALVASTGVLPSCGAPVAMLEPVIVGALVSDGSSLGVDGVAWLNAIRLAEREVAAMGGLLGGRPVRVLVVDGELDPDVSVARARRLVLEEGAVALAGDTYSAGARAVYREVGAPLRVPMVSCCASSTTLTDDVRAQSPEDRFFFRVMPPDDMQAFVIADIAREEGMCTRLAIMHVDDDYGAPLSVAITAAFEAHGGAVVARVPFDEGRADYASQVAEVAESAPDCVALIAFPASGGAILRSWAALPASSRPERVQWIGADALKTEQLAVEVVDPAIIDGLLGSVPAIESPTSPTAAYESFRVAYQAAWDVRPVTFTSTYYDSTAVLLLAIELAGDTDGEAIRDALHRLSDPDGETVDAGDLAEGLRRIRAGERVNYVGASGPVDFDELGNVVTDYDVWRYRSGVGFETIRVVAASQIVR